MSHGAFLKKKQSSRNRKYDPSPQNQHIYICLKTVFQSLLLADKKGDETKLTEAISEQKVTSEFSS